MLFADGADGMVELGLDLTIGNDKYWLLQKKNHWLWLFLVYLRIWIRTKFLINIERIKKNLFEFSSLVFWL